MHPDLILTGKAPDIVIHDKSSSPHKIILLELTFPWDTAAKNAESRKTLRYERLTLDLEEEAFEVLNMPLEVGSGAISAQETRGCWLVSPPCVK